MQAAGDGVVVALICVLQSTSAGTNGRRSRLLSVMGGMTRVLVSGSCPMPPPITCANFLTILLFANVTGLEIHMIELEPLEIHMIELELMSVRG